MALQWTLYFIWLCLTTNITFVLGRLEFYYGIPEDQRCSLQDIAIIEEEALAASDIARIFDQNSMDYGGYIYHLFPPETYTDILFPATMENRYNRLATLIDENAYVNGIQYTLRVSCNFNICDLDAHEVADVDTYHNIMNICPLFFQLEATRDFKDWWSNPNSQDKLLLTMNRIANLRSTGLLHEFTHTTYGFNTDNWATTSEDTAYGIADCMSLAAGHLDRTGIDGPDDWNNPDSDPECPQLAWVDNAHTIPWVNRNGDQAIKEGLCNPTKSASNADTLAFYAAGMYFSRWANFIIPMNADDRGTDRATQNAIEAQRQAQQDLYRGDVRQAYPRNLYRLSPVAPMSIHGQWTERAGEWYWHVNQYPEPPQRRSNELEKRASRRPHRFRRVYHSGSSQCRLSNTRWYRTTAMNIYFQGGTTSDGTKYICDLAYAFYRKLK